MIDPQIFIIISIIVTFFFLFIYKTSWSMYGLIALLPLMHKEIFSIYKWDYLPVRFAVIGMFAGLLIHLILIGRKEGLHKLKDFIYFNYLKDKLFILLGIVFLVKIFASITAGSFSLNNEFILFFTLILALYLSIKFATSKDPNLTIKLIIGYLIIAFFSIIFAGIQFLLISHFNIKIGAIWPVPNNLPRLGSTYWDVNHFGGFLVTVIPIFFVLVFGLKNKILVAVSLVGLSLSSLTLFLTQSRSSWLGLAISMVIGIILLMTRKRYKPVLLFIIGIITMSSVFFAYLDIKDLSLRQKVASYMHYRLDSTDTHVMLLEGALQIYMKDPVLGSGPGNFDSSFRKIETSEKYFEREPNLKNQEVPPHSVWGEIISETGYLGFATYVFMTIFLLMANLYSYYKSTKKSYSYLSLGFFIGLLGIYITGVFYSYNLEFYWFYAFLSFLFTTYSLGKDISIHKIFSWVGNQKILYLGVLLSVSTFFIFINLGGVSLIEWDEAIYAKVSRNILLSGDWITLHWTQLDKHWFEKPPLYMWLSALTFLVTGANEFGARLWAGIFGVLSIFVVYVLGNRLFNRLTGYVSALILLSTAHFLYYSRNSILDVPVTFFILSSLLFYYLARNNNQRKNLFLYLISGILIGLAVMTKSIVGLIPFAIIVLFEITENIFDRKDSKSNMMGLLLIVISSIMVFLPWHLYSYLIHGQKFINTYLFEHVFDRSTSGLGHVMPLFWYSDVILSSFRIWIFPLLIGIPYFAYMFNKDKAIRLLLISAFFIFIFFSLPKDKLLWYIVPIYPFISILSARFIERVLVFVVKNLELKSLSIAKSRIIFVVIFTLFIPFYITTIWDKVFFEDENRDIVELVKVHNQLYPVKDYPNLYLRYASVPYTVILFYSDHQPKATDKDELLNLIDDAEPTRFYTFLITENRFYEMRGKLKDEVNIQADLRIKASSGRYVIARSYSRVELLNERLIEIDPIIKSLLYQQGKGSISDFDIEKLNSLVLEYKNIVNQLTIYGQKIENPIIFN